MADNPYPTPAKPKNLIPWIIAGIVVAAFATVIVMNNNKVSGLNNTIANLQAQLADAKGQTAQVQAQLDEAKNNALQVQAQ